jgi:hypothetical protein
VFKLASHIVREGPLQARDAAGWVVRLCLALEVLHRVRASHGRLSARAIQLLGTTCEGGGFFLDGLDLAEDIGYHSPERLAGAEPSPEDDTWAAGVLLYYAVTGAMPFGGNTPAQLLAQIRRFRPAPLFRLGLNLPNLQSVIDDVLCADASRRIRSVSELRARLVQCMPSTKDLPVLKLGKPDLSILADEATDGEGVKLTGVARREDVDRQIQEVLEKRDALRRAAALGGVIDEDSGGLPTRQIRERHAPPPSDLPALSWEELPESQVPSAARAYSSGVDSVPASYWADDESEIEVSFEVIDSVAMDEGSEDTTQIRASVPPRSLSVPPAAPGTARPSVPPAMAATARPSVPPAVAGTTPRSAHAAMLERKAAPPETSSSAAPTTEDSGLDTVLRSPWGRMLAAAAFVVLGGAAAYLLLGPRPLFSSGSTPSATAPAAPDEPMPGPSAGLAASSGSAAASARPLAAGSAARPPRPGGDLAGCVAALFPKGSFALDKRRPRVDFVCSERDARKGAKAMNAQLVVGAGPGVVSEGMRDWAQLGWYEMALFATAQVLCCDQPAALSTRTGANVCALDRALEQLGQAAVKGDDATLGKAIAGYKETATCLLRQGGAGRYVDRGVPGRAAAAAFGRFLARIRPTSGR